MPQAVAHYNHPRGGHPRAHGVPASRPHSHQHAHAQPRRYDYTFAHAGRQVRIGPVAFWIVVGTLVIMGVWSIGTGTYFAFRESVLTGLMARNASMQTAYEDRIAELRGQLDRITSRQLLDQEQFDQKLDQIMRRQMSLENRATTLSTLPDSTPTGSIGRSRPAPLMDPQ